MDYSLKSSARVNARQFMELPDGHRTTFVVGMIDMWYRLTEYMPDDLKFSFDRLMNEIDHMNSGDARREFDRYLAEMEVEPGKSYTIASCFISFLLEKKEDKGEHGGGEDIYLPQKSEPRASARPWQLAWWRRD